MREFFELSLSPWDYAAGALIVKEAGGLVSDINGKELTYDHQCSVIARNKVVPILAMQTSIFQLSGKHGIRYFPIVGKT